MKMIRISVVAFLAFLATSCNQSVVESSQETSSQQTVLIQDCLDSKMEQWYKAFNHYQLEGYNMFAADLKALQEADAVFDSCQKQNQISAEKTALN